MAPHPPIPTPNLYRATKQQWLHTYEQALEHGDYRPFIYPWDSLPALWLLLALLILPRLPNHISKYARFPVIVLIFVHCGSVMRSCRTVGLAGGFGIGLAACWGCIMTLALLMFNDLKKDFVRLETRVTKGGLKVNEHSNGLAISTGSQTRQNGTERKLKDRSSVLSTAFEQDGNNNSQYTLVWQHYPTSIFHAIDWSVDLVTAFRGVNWNFRNPTVAALPKDITTHPHATDTQQLSQTQHTALIVFLCKYIEVDIVKTLCIHDPYFLGLAPLSSPSPYALLQPYPFLTRLFRLLLAVTSTNTVLAFIFTLCPLIYPILPQSFTSTPLRHPSMYPPFNHPLFPTIATSGLAGFWGKFWHQMFRFGISQPGKYITAHLNLNPKGDVARTLQVLLAFCLSGFIHASASYTAFPPNKNISRPMWGSWLFFMMQAVGILLQTWMSRVAKKLSVPQMLRWVGNVLFVAAWLWVTGPLLADDFARCGVWLFEPLPVSLLRGVRGEGWWMWGGRWAGWWQGTRWWHKGIAIY